MEIKGNVEVQGFTRICDLEQGTVFVFCDDSEPMLVGYNHQNGAIYVICLSDGEVFEVYDERWEDRPVRQIKAVLTVE